MIYASFGFPTVLNVSWWNTRNDDLVTSASLWTITRNSLGICPNAGIPSNCKGWAARKFTKHVVTISKLSPWNKDIKLKQWQLLQSRRWTFSMTEKLPFFLTDKPWHKNKIIFERQSFPYWKEGFMSRNSNIATNGLYKTAYRWKICAKYLY